jgi:hypothetical protein
VGYATLSVSYLPDNELEGKGAGENLVLCMEDMWYGGKY